MVSNRYITLDHSEKLGDILDFSFNLANDIPQVLRGEFYNATLLLRTAMIKGFLNYSEKSLFDASRNVIELKILLTGNESTPSICTNYFTEIIYLVRTKVNVEKLKLFVDILLRHGLMSQLQVLEISNRSADYMLSIFSKR